MPFSTWPRKVCPVSCGKGFTKPSSEAAPCPAWLLVTLYTRGPKRQYLARFSELAVTVHKKALAREDLLAHTAAQVSGSLQQRHRDKRMMECSSCARLCNRGLLPQSQAPDLWDRRLVSTAHLSEGHRSTAQGMHEACAQYLICQSSEQS